MYPAECITDDREWLWRDDIEGDSGPECPVYLGQEFDQFFFGWAMLDKGLLPHAGGWADQPHYWTEAMDVIGAAVAAENAKKLREKQNP